MIYYVRPDGNNTNAGTGPATNQAWATLSKAVSTMVAGDTCYVAPGIYRENIQPTNSGTSDSVRIKLLGDPRCLQFPGVTAGDVIWSGMPSETQLAAGYAFDLNNRSWWTVEDFVWRDSANSCTLQTGTVLRRLRITASGSSGTGAIRFTAASGTTPVVEDCVINGTEFCVFKDVNAIGIVRRCAFSQTSEKFMQFYSGGSLSFEFCIINGSIYNPANTNWGGSLSFYGCVIKSKGKGNTSLSAFIYHEAGSDTGVTYTFRGCTVSNFAVLLNAYASNANQLTVSGCLFENFTNGLRSDGIYTANTIFGGRNMFRGGMVAALQIVQSVSINNLDFERCYTHFNVNSGATLTISGCRGHVCLYGAEKIGSGTLSGASTFGEFEQSCGNIVAMTNPIAGAKSLKMQGFGNAPAHVQWVACEAGKAKTVKLKVKLPATSGCGFSMFLGDQTAAATAGTTAVQTITLTYTHHKTELVPLWLCATPETGAGSFILVDDITA